MRAHAARVSSTSTTSARGSAISWPRPTTTSAAPASIAAGTKACPSCRSPRNATKAPPGTTARLSVVTPRATRPVARAARPPVSSATVRASRVASFVPMGVANAHVLSGAPRRSASALRASMRSSNGCFTVPNI